MISCQFISCQFILFLTYNFVSTYAYRHLCFYKGVRLTLISNVMVLCYLIILFVHITSNRGRLAVTSKLGLTHRIMILCLVKTLLLCEQSDAIFSAVNNNKRSSKVANKDSVNFTTIWLLWFDFGFQWTKTVQINQIWSGRNKGVNKVFTKKIRKHQ